MSHDPQYKRRWLILAAVSVAQLIVVLDATITSIALPSAQHDLGFGADTRQWVVTAYALAFGSLLLLGGRLGDYFGRKWAFVGGLIGFAGASAVGGASSSFGMLVGARAAQGVFAAVLAPSALSLLTTTFTEPSERGKAFGVFAAVASAGSGLGMLLGGVLTQWLSWRWCLYVNLIFAVPVALTSVRLLVRSRPSQRLPLDYAGIATVTTGLFALVYGLAYSETHGWANVVTIALLAAAVVLLGLFVAVETRVAYPLLPMRIITDRIRAGAFAAVAVAGSAIFAAFLFLTYYMQQTKGYTPIQTGVGFLPLALTIMISAPNINTVLLAKIGPRPLMVFGMAAGALAMMWFTQLTPTATYATAILPGLIVLGLAMATIMAPAFSTATSRIQPPDAGVASGLINTMQQVGASVGTALLSSIFATAVAADLSRKPHTPDALRAASLHGYTVAFWFAAGLFACGGIIVGSLMPPTHRDASAGRSEPHPERVTA